jgi:hypothetical protein
MRDDKIGPKVPFDQTQKKRKQEPNTYSLNENPKREADEKRGGHIEKLAKMLHGKDPYCASHKL